MDLITLYARHEHGGHPVHLGLDSNDSPILEVVWPNGITRYPSARQLIRALYNHGDTNPSTSRDPGVGLSRYFQIGSQQESQGTPIDIFGYHAPNRPSIETIQALLSPRRPPIREHSIKAIPKDEEITTLELFATPPPLSVATTNLPVVPTGVDVLPDGIGIDLVKRGHEVRKLLFAGFSGKMTRAGYDPEEILQEVYRGIVARNQGRCRFDPKKSSFGHYVHMVINCVLLNYHRKDSKRRAYEQVGMWSGTKAEAQVDAALVASTKDDRVSDPEPVTVAMDSLVDALWQVSQKEKTPEEILLAIDVLPLLYQGYTRAQMASRLGRPIVHVSRAVNLIKQVATTWAMEQGLRP